MAESLVAGACVREIEMEKKIDALVAHCAVMIHSCACISISFCHDPAE